MSASADHVPDPEDAVMEADYNDQIYQMADEPVDDFDVGQNANNDEDCHDRESTPIPEEAVPKYYEQKSSALETERHGESYNSFVVNTAAVDIESLCQNYEGYPLVIRLEFLIDHGLVLKRDAMIALINVMQKDFLNVSRYVSLHSALEVYEKAPNEQFVLETPVFDQSWVDTSSARASGKLEQLNSEYKKQKDEGVKESTRRAMEDLFQHFLYCGQPRDALKLYARGMREYCSLFKHIIQMWLNWLEVTITSDSWERVDSLVQQAERSIADAEQAELEPNATASAPRNSRPSHPNGAKCSKQLIASGKSKVDVLSGLARMHQGKYKPAADKFLRAEIEHLSGKWVLSASDIAVYGTLCALATYDRTDIKKRAMGDVTFRKFLEAEPKLVDLLQSFIRSQFGRCFDIMNELKDRFLLDPFLSCHVSSLYQMIRERAIVQYMTPFAVADINTMAGVFRVSVPQMENEMVFLIEGGQLNATIDSVGGLVSMNKRNERQETYDKIMLVCDDMIERTEAVLFRACLVQSRIAIQGDKESRGKRKPAYTDDANDPVIPNRQKMSVSVTGMVRALRGKTAPVNVVNPSEADSSEGSEEPKEPEI